MTTGNTCNTSADRNKAELVEFYEIYDAIGSDKYEDKNFTPDDTSIFWADMNESSNLAGIGWLRGGGE